LYDFEFKIVGGAEYFAEGVHIVSKEWRLMDEVKDIQSFDIGVMPLCDDAWTRGKSGFKLLQYMVAGIPVVASRVGVNCEIVQDGQNGFLATDEDEWMKKLSLLMENPGLRKRFGMEGRKTVIQRYSVECNFEKWYDAIANW
jgi:glycosyltransferase involved in cell wall biosynthesis